MRKERALKRKSWIRSPREPEKTDERAEGTSERSTCGEVGGEYEGEDPEGDDDQHNERAVSPYNVSAQGAELAELVFPIEDFWDEGAGDKDAEVAETPGGNQEWRDHVSTSVGRA